MAAAPSAGMGTTGLERLLLIFLMKLSESQSVANDTYFSYDRLSDQPEKTVRNSARKLKNTANLQTACNSTRNHRFPRGEPNERKNSNSTEQITRKQQKPHFTDQKPKRTV